MSQSYINVIGAGLAGLKLHIKSQNVVFDSLYEMGGVKSFYIFQTNSFAELVCYSHIKDALTNTPGFSRKKCVAVLLSWNLLKLRILRAVPPRLRS